MECKNCKHAKMAGNKEYIACGLLSCIKHGLEPIPEVSDKHGNRIRPYDFNDFFLNFVKFKDENEVYEGWAYLACKPESEPKGWLKNFCVITPKNNSCNFWENNIK